MPANKRVPVSGVQDVNAVVNVDGGPAATRASRVGGGVDTASGRPAGVETVRLCGRGMVWLEVWCGVVVWLGVWCNGVAGRPGYCAVVR